MQDRIRRIEETSCDARPDHINGSFRLFLTVLSGLKSGAMFSLNLL